MPMPRLPIAAALGLLCLGVHAGPGRASDAVREPPSAGHAPFLAGHFRLTAADGSHIDSDTLAGRPYALFFGFTNCPDVCPATLTEASLALAQLPAGASDLQVYFVSVDPEHDTPAVLSRDMASFHPQIVGLTGDRAAVDEAIRSFGVVARRADLPNGRYAYGHTAAILLIDADGLIVDRVSPGAGPDALARKLAALTAPRLASASPMP